MFKSSLYLKLALLVLVLLAINKNYQVNSHNHHGHHHDHGHVHNHHHGHHHEDDDMYRNHDYEDDHVEANPAFKYSRAANEKPAQQQHAHSHNNHHHGHSHGAGDHGHSHDHHHHAHSHGNQQQQHQKTNEKRSFNDETKKTASSGQKVSRNKFTIILYACFSTLLISIAPFLILFFIPLNNNRIENQALLKILLGFASGSLLGDAFLHLIPHALNPHDHSTGEHSHSHAHSHSDGHHDHSGQTLVGLWVLAGILTFLLVEKAVRHTHSHSHGHSHEKTESDNDKKNEDNKEESTDNKPKRKDATKEPKESKDETESKEKKPEEPKNEIQVAGYLNLAADFAHNFTDGLAIGASFLAGHNIGIVTTLTILFHEVPHEIGDFAILIQSGCTKTKAIYLQLFTALGALTGTLLSLIFESAISGVATSCILPFTAGGFIYIATVSIIPELKESSGFLQSLKEILALAAGVLMMVVIAYIE